MQNSKTALCIYRVVIIQVIIIQLALLSPSAQAKLTFLATISDNIVESHGALQPISKFISPDGKYLVYSSLRKDNLGYSLYSVATSGGKKPIELTTADMFSSDMFAYGDRDQTGTMFKISPDSRRVVFRANAGGSRGLFSVPIDGSGSPTQLTGVEVSQVDSQFLGDFFISDSSRLVVYSLIASTQEPSTEPDDRLFIRLIDGESQPTEIELGRILRDNPLPNSAINLETYNFAPKSENVYVVAKVGDDITALKNFQIYSMESGKKPEIIYAFALPADVRTHSFFNGKSIYSGKSYPVTRPFHFIDNARSIISISKNDGNNNQLFIEDVAKENRNRKLLSNLEDNVNSIVAISEPWVLYTTAETDASVDSIDSILDIPPVFLTNINQPDLNHRIDAKIGFGDLWQKRIVILQQKLFYTSVIANNDEATEGIFKLMSEPLEGASAEKPAVQFAEGSWERDPGSMYPKKMTNYTISPDDRWVIQNIESKNQDRLFQTRWISLENNNVSFDTNIAINTDITVYAEDFSPTTDRLLMDKPDLEGIASQLGYDLMRTPDHSGISLPDNCRIMQEGAAPSTQPPPKFTSIHGVFVSDCDRPLTEVWWNPSFSGQGISTQQRGDRIQATWFVYDEAGEPLWLDFSGKLVNNQLSAPLLRFTGPELGSDWDNSKVQSEQLGTATLTLGDDKLSATLQYSISGVDSTIQLQPFYDGPANVYNGYWWDPQTSGRGLRLYRKGNELFGIAFLYDQSGNDMWLTFQGQSISDQFTGKLFRSTGPKLGEKWDMNLIQHQEVGDITLKFNTNGRINAQLEINGQVFDWSLQPFRF
jgi:hypothetical protein